MNDRMEIEIERTIANLRSSMPTKLRKQTTIFKRIDFSFEHTYLLFGR